VRTGDARRLWSPVGASDEQTDEARAFLRRRVAFFIGICFTLWTVIAIVSQLAALAWAPPGGTGTVQPMFWIHLGVSLALGGTWALVRFARVSPGALVFIDLFSMLDQGVAGALILPFTLVQFRADLSMVMGLAFVSIVRAAIVPSTARRTFAITFVSNLPTVVATYVLYARAGAGAPLPPVVAASQVATWALMGTALSTVVSRVIYGLRQQVRKSARLGQYILEEKIGEGGMGAVFRARHTLLRRPTAVKVLSPERTGEVSLARFEREVQLTSEISHPNIIAVYDYGRSLDGAFYYAMEYLNGFDLQRLVDVDGPQPPGRVVHVLAQAADALAEAHAVGLIHRDVKPGNIVLCEHPRRPDQVKVVDFGLVRQLGNSDPTLSTADAIAGTPLYLSPEAITSPNDLDARSDIYALGAVGYFLLTGQAVFQGESVLQVLTQALHQPVESPSDRSGRPVPAQLERVILSCLARERDERPRDASAVKDALIGCSDVTPWTSEDAQNWWSTRAERVRKQGGNAEHAQASPFSATLAVAPRPE
jgi:hypothetical protein